MNPVEEHNQLDVQGHRGCRGHLPENSIPAFVEALAMGVTTLELDVIISSDDQVVVSHEPWLSHELYHFYENESITEENERQYNLYDMTYAEIESMAFGQFPHPRFPDQNRMLVKKPLLKDVITTAETAVHNKDRALPFYNIEIKRVKEQDEVFHPEYKKFTDLVIETIEQSSAKDRVIIQCFDQDVLRYMKEKYPEYPLALLVENTQSFQTNIEGLGFIPDIYSPYFRFVSTPLMQYARENNMRVIPWTVNKKIDILWLLSMKVDGIISDYPERAIEVVEENRE